MSGKALIFSAPSGAGKTTIVQHLLTRFPELQFSISATTRPIRHYEVADKDYYFISIDEFNRMRENKEMLEWEEVYDGVFYATLLREVERIWEQGGTVVFDVDVQGGIRLKKKLGEQALSVFVRTKDTNVLKERLEKRGTENSRTLEERIDKANHEMTFESQFDKVLVNDELKSALSEAELMVRAFIK